MRRMEVGIWNIEDGETQKHVSSLYSNSHIPIAETLGTNCVQLVREAREKQWDIFPQNPHASWTTTLHPHTALGFTHPFPTFPRQLFAVFYTRNFAAITDRIRGLSTLSTPPITTITIY